MARPGTQRDRSLRRPVTAPCSHDPPTLQDIFTLSCWYAIAQAKTRPALTRHGEGRRVPARALPPGPGPGFGCSGKCILSRLNPPDKASDRPLRRPVTVALSSPPYTDPVPPSGGYPSPAQRPEGAPLQGAKATSRISGESEPLMRRADESLSVRHLLSTQRRTRCGAWCEERARAAAGAGAARQARGVILPTGQLR